MRRDTPAKKLRLLFFWKKKKVVLDCFTPYAIYATDNPPAKPSSFIPDWWRRLPSSIDMSSPSGVTIQMPTMRNCTGFMDLHRYGVMIPLWCDINVKIANGKFAWHSASQFDNHSHVATHPEWHYGGHYKELVHFKFVPPWRFREKTGVRFGLAGYPWVFADKFPNIHVLNGVAEFRSQPTAQFNCFAVKRESEYQYNFEAGTPLLHLLPLTTLDVVPRVHVVSESEFDSMDKGRSKYKFFPLGSPKLFPFETN